MQWTSCQSVCRPRAALILVSFFVFFVAILLRWWATDPGKVKSSLRLASLIAIGRHHPKFWFLTRQLRAGGELKICPCQRPMLKSRLSKSVAIDPPRAPDLIEAPPGRGTRKFLFNMKRRDFRCAKKLRLETSDSRVGHDDHGHDRSERNGKPPARPIKTGGG